jgi:transposase-like protein
MEWARAPGKGAVEWEYGTAIAIRRVEYLNDIVEQDRRVVKRVTRPLIGCKLCEAAPYTLADIELIPRLKKG